MRSLSARAQFFDHLGGERLGILRDDGFERRSTDDFLFRVSENVLGGWIPFGDVEFVGRPRRAVRCAGAGLKGIWGEL